MLSVSDLCFSSIDWCLNMFRNAFVDKVLKEEIILWDDKQFLKVSLEPHPSVVYLKGSINQGVY